MDDGDRPFPRLRGGPPDGSTWPAGWARPTTMAALGWAMAAFGFAGLVSGVFALAAATRAGDVRVLVLGLSVGGFGALVLFGAGVTNLRPRTGPPPRTATIDGRVGSFLPCSRARVTLAVAAGSGAALCGGGLMLGGAVGLGWPGWVLGPLVLAAGVATVVGALRQTGLLLTSDGVLHVGRTFVPWSDVLVIRATHSRIGGPPELELLRVGARKPVNLSPVLWLLAADPATVYGMLADCTLHPGRRSQLAAAEETP